jgi:NADH dehydrogenase
LQNYELALNARNPLDKEACLNIVVVGGGATGVELAGALAEMKNFILPKDYPELDFSLMSIYLFEASPKLLGSMSERSSAKAKIYLEKLGVKVNTETFVKDYDGKHVLLSDGKKHLTFNLIWSAGVTATVFNGIEEKNLGRGGRILVDHFNESKGLKTIFALGDLALMNTDEYPEGHPQVAQTAIQQAINLANNFKNLKAGKPLKKFSYRDKGSLATIGRHLAVADLGKLKFQGFFAWVLWSLVHVMSIIGVKNKLLVLMDWSWNYFTYDPSLRLLIRPAGKKNNSR